MDTPRHKITKITVATLVCHVSIWTLGKLSVDASGKLTTHRAHKVVRVRLKSDDASTVIDDECTVDVRKIHDTWHTTISFDYDIFIGCTREASIAEDVDSHS